MRVSWFRSLSLRIPLLLLLFVIIAGSYSFINHTRQAEQHIENQQLNQMAQSMSRLQGTVQYLLNANDIERIHEEIASLGADRAYQHALLVNDSGLVIASLSRSHINQPAAALLGKQNNVWRGQVEDLIERTTSNLDSQILLSHGNASVIGVYPVSFGVYGNALRSTRYGVLLLERDLLVDKAFATRAVGYQLLEFAIVLVLVALVLAVITHYLVTRRVGRLVECTTKFAQGDHAARAQLSGNDELSVIAHAFDNMANEVSSTHRKLVDSELKVRLLLESSQEAIFTIGLDGKTSFCNLATAEMFGNENATNLLGKPLLELLYPGGIPDCPPFSSEQIYAGFQGGSKVLSGEIPLQHLDGVDFCAEYRAYPIYRDAELTGTVFSFTDISDRKKAELERALAASVFDHSNDGILITDANLRVLRVNEAFEKITGYSHEDAVGRSPSELLQSHHHDKQFYQKIWSSILNTGNWTGEIWDRKKNGEVFPAWQSINAVRDEHGTIDKYISVFSDITERKLAEQNIERLAHFDALTGLPNRLLFNDRLKNALVRARRRGTYVALFFIDLDRFKIINDTLGHPVGDQLLKEVAQRLKDSVREEDTVARLGGDEFTVILEDITDPHMPLAIGNKIVEAMSRTFEFSGHSLMAGASIGISLFPDDGDSHEALIKNADTAMYEAKSLGRNRCVRYTVEHSALTEKHFLMERDLRQALEREEFVVYYQPQALSDGTIKGAEALVRWQRPDGSLIPPLEFLGMAKEIGLLAKLDRYVLFTACKQAVQWQNEGLKPIRIAVNLSGVQINDGSIVATVNEALSESGLDASLLELEITEGFIMANPERAIATLEHLRELGITLAIDDFGTGHSSLGYLKRLPVNRLKIDRSFVRDIAVDNDDRTIVAAIISMAKHLKLELIAEGVESDRHLSMLRQLGCNEIQGYYFSPPVAAEDFAVFITADSKLPASAGEY